MWRTIKGGRSGEEGGGCGWLWEEVQRASEEGKKFVEDAMRWPPKVWKIDAMIMKR